MAEELFKPTTTNQTKSQDTNVTPPVTKDMGKGDASQTTQDPEKAKEPPKVEPSKEQASSSGSATVVATEAEPPKPDELQMLKQRADMMGIGYSNNIGIDALKKKIQDKMDGKKDEPEAKAASAETVNALTGTIEVPKVESKQDMRERLLAEGMKLVRLRITNLDPKKKDLRGEIMTVANRYIGTVRKFIPYGETTDNGYHVPYCLYEQLRDRQFMSIKVRKDQVTGKERVDHQMVKEFALEILEPLTEGELAKLAAQQAANGSLQEDL